MVNGPVLSGRSRSMFCAAARIGFMFCGAPRLGFMDCPENIGQIRGL